MPWGWTDSIDATTDLQDVELWNKILRAVHRRGLAGNVFNDSGSIIDSDPTPTVDEDPPTKAAGDVLHYGDADLPAPWDRATVAEMQTVLGNAIPAFLNTLLYPAGLAGQTSIPADLRHTHETIAAELGHPVHPGHVVLWRRKQPRRIFTLDATHSQKFVWSGVDGWYERADMASPCQAGDRAQFYDFGPLDTGLTGDPENPVPGDYKGIYEYDGSDWTPAAAGTAADTLDSDEAVDTHLFCSPGHFERGDIYGHWLFADLRDACNLLTHTIPVAVSYSAAGGANAQSYKLANSSGSHATAADAKADAEAALAAASVTTIGHTGATPVSTYTEVAGGGSSWSASIKSTRLQAGAPIYDGIAREVQWVAISHAIDASTYSAQGLSLVEDAWSVFDTTSHAAATHAYPINLSDAQNAAYAVPTWAADNDRLGFTIFPPFVVTPDDYSLAAIVEWDFADAA